MPSEYRFACISTLSDFGSFLQETGRYNENTVERYVNFVKKFVVTEADKVDDLKIAYETVASKAFAKNVREVYAYDKGQRGKACEMFGLFIQDKNIGRPPSSGASGSSGPRPPPGPPPMPPRSKSQKRQLATMVVDDGEGRKAKKCGKAASPGTAKSPNTVKGYDSSDSSDSSDDDSEVNDVGRSVGSLSLAAPATAPSPQRTRGILKSGEQRDRPRERTRHSSIACKDFTVTVRNAWVDGFYSNSPKGGSFVTCDACGQRVEPSGGVLLRQNGKPLFASDTFICQPCNAHPTPAPQTPAPPPEHAWDFSRGQRDWSRQSWAQRSNNWWY